jgi:hypothetical protein
MIAPSEARAVLPTDLLALVAHNGRDYPNEAWTRERLGLAASSSLAVQVALNRLRSLGRDRNAWICGTHRRLHALAGARQRGGKQAWEVDCLIDATPDHSAVAGVLELAIGDTGRNGAEKLFLRMEADSDLLPDVLDCGFLAYQEESLYARVGIASGERDPALRSMNPSDSYPAYRLYNATTPESVRRLEAATFSEWHAAQERRWLRNGVQLVSDNTGGLDAVVRAARLPQGVAVELSIDPAATLRIEALIRGAVQAVEGSSLPVFILTPKGSAAVGALESAGFAHQDDYVSLMRRTTRTVAVRQLVPAIANTAVGV